MRSFKSLLGLASAAALLSLIFCTESDACGRRRNCAVPTTPCGIPCWARCMKNSFDKSVSCATAGFPYAWCYKNGTWVPWDSTCDDGACACTNINQPPAVFFEGFIDNSKYDSGCKCLMVCDPCTHRMRLALPCETGWGYFPCKFLGHRCNPPTM
jgi:hypothetical protein